MLVRNMDMNSIKQKISTDKIKVWLFDKKQVYNGELQNYIEVENTKELFLNRAPDTITLLFSSGVLANCSFWKHKDIISLSPINY